MTNLQSIAARTYRGARQLLLPSTVALLCMSAFAGAARADGSRACTDEDWKRITQPATASGWWALVNCSGSLPKPGTVLPLSPPYTVPKLTRSLRFCGEDSSNLDFDLNHTTVPYFPTHNSVNILSNGSGSCTDGFDAISVAYNTNDTVTITGQPIHDVRITNGHVDGPVRIYGLGQNAGDPQVATASHHPGYVQAIRGIAPRNITLDNVAITGRGTSLVYLGPGVQHVTFENSLYDGCSSTADATLCPANTAISGYSYPAFYLEAESSGAVLRNNYFFVHAGRAEIIAIDGSYSNSIIDNYISDAVAGGIFLYRNCGEKGKNVSIGTVRYSTPHHNTITNNYFYYVHLQPDPDGSNASVLVGSRSEDPTANGAINCADDDYPVSASNPLPGYLVGSSADTGLVGGRAGTSVDEYDYATYNVILQNQVRVLDPNLMLKLFVPYAPGPGAYTPINSPDYFVNNETVTDRIDRASSCYIMPPTIGSGVIGNGVTRQVSYNSGATYTTVKCCDGLLVSGTTCPAN